MQEYQLQYMVNRFLSWKLPETFNPDGGIKFEPGRIAGYKFEPVGTNLFSAAEAMEMVLNMVDGLPAAVDNNPFGEQALIDKLGTLCGIGNWHTDNRAKLQAIAQRVHQLETQTDWYCRVDKNGQILDISNKRDQIEAWGIFADSLPNHADHVKPFTPLDALQLAYALDRASKQATDLVRNDHVKSMIEAHNQIRNMVDNVRADPASTDNDYLRGYANGLILALAVFKHNDAGESIKAGEWAADSDGYEALIIDLDNIDLTHTPPPPKPRIVELAGHGKIVASKAIDAVAPKPPATPVQHDPEIAPHVFVKGRNWPEFCAICGHIENRACHAITVPSAAPSQFGAVPAIEPISNDKPNDPLDELEKLFELPPSRNLDIGTSARRDPIAKRETEK